MVFGKKKKQNYEEMESETEEGLEKEDDEIEEEQEQKQELKKLKQENKILRPSARIVSNEIIGNGVYKIVLITNKLIGEVGEEFQI
jgi:hypothetical protein